MRQLELVDIVKTDRFVSQSHFGGNVIYRKNTENGIPKNELQMALRELDINIARYPAGEADLAFADGMLINDALPTHLQNYLLAARKNGQAVVVVTPTHSGYQGSEDFTEFTRLLLNEFRDVIHAIEIGNEYWGHQTETSYGKVANDSILAIKEGFQLAGTEVPIWVQMGDAGGIESEFHSTKSDEGWLWRNIFANEKIINQLSPEARHYITGVVEHYYFRETTQSLGDLINDQNILLDFDIWQAALGKDITLNITEWNIRTTNLSQLGVRAASTLITQFSYMLEMNVDEAYIWAPMHNTSTDLAGADYVIIDEQTGIVLNSVGGAIFDMMSTSLVGLEYLPSSVSSSSSKINHYVYADDHTVVVYLASRSNSTEEISFSLGDTWESALITSAIQLGYDQHSSNGLHYDYTQNRFVESEYVIVNGSRYFINEHDVNASVHVIDTSNLPRGGEIAVTLQPYEVVEITYQLSDYSFVADTYCSDLISEENSVDEFYYSSVGADAVPASGCDDTVEVGACNVYEDGGSNTDSIDGCSGAEVLRGITGSDHQKGVGDDDYLEGRYENDIIVGGEGADLLVGGEGNDTIYAGNGADIVIGGTGDDIICLSSSRAFDSWSYAFNISNDFQFGTGTSFSVADRKAYSTLISGGDGFDEIKLSDADDAFFLHDSLSEVHPSSNISAVSHGLGPSVRIVGVERIDAGDGHDIIDLTSSAATLTAQNIEIFAGAGNDMIWGSTANETIVGGSGNDTLFGGAGENILIGSSGADTFEFTASSGKTSVLDFSTFEGDRIVIFADAHLGSNEINLFSDHFTVSHNNGVLTEVMFSSGAGRNLTIDDLWSVIDVL